MNIAELRRDELNLEGAGLRWIGIFAAVGALGLMLTVLLVAGSEYGVERFFRSYLVNFMFFLSLALGGLFFVLIMHLTRAGWSVALRRLAEVLAWSVAPLFLFALVLLFGMHELYEWTHTGAVATDPLLQHKRPYLNDGFFIGRFIFYFLVWNVTASFFLRQSVRQDASRSPAATLLMERVAAPAMIFYAMTVTFAVFDWIMSLYPHWYSTIFGLYYFAGSVLGFLALVPLLVSMLQWSGKLRDVIRVEQLHDVGKFIFAFVVFWAYIAFSQYMLIWIANVPEETVFYAIRQSGPWAWISIVLLIGHFFVPFIWLLSKHMKRRKLVLIAAATWILLMHWLDLHYLIMPTAGEHQAPFHWLDLTTFLMLAGFVFAAVFWRLGRASLVPVGDPRLPEALGAEHA